jgi:3-hydroxymyristoyl/3-hydroxydecanoyl-(acyl carrier protein) dehydratase
MRYVGEEIYKVIPNRYPLMLLNSLTVEEDSAIGQIDLKGDEWFFQCHFPGRPIMPLSLLIPSETDNSRNPCIFFFDSC